MSLVQKYKRCLFFLFFLILFLIPSSVYANTGVSLSINGKDIDTSMLGSPYISESNRTMIPLRLFAEDLRFQVDWNDVNRVASVSTNLVRLKFYLSDLHCELCSLSDEEGILEIDIDSFPEIKNNRIYVPARFISETFGCEVSWDAKQRKVSIDERIFSFPADSEKGFNYPYLIYIPKTLSYNTKIIFSTLNSGKVLVNEVELYKIGLEQLNNFHMKDISDDLGYPIIMPLVERPEGVYTHALSSESIIKCKDRWSELDKQYVVTIKESEEFLSKFSKVDAKVITYGFSAAGQSAHRFAILHPEMVQAVVAGGLGSQITLPYNSYKGLLLHYPIGVGDLCDYGLTFNLKEYNKIPQFIFQGDEDDNLVTLNTDSYTDLQMFEYYNILNKDFNSSNKERWDIIIDICKADKIQFVSYEGAGHNFNFMQCRDFLRSL